jgi:competence protein ComEC
MKVWNSFPMLRLLLPFLAGVVSSAFVLELVEVLPKQLYVGLGLSILTVLVLVLFGHQKRKPYVFGLVLFPILFVLGSLLTLSVSDQIFKDHIRPDPDGNAKTYIAVVDEQPKEKSKTIELVAKVSDVDGQTFGKVLLYVERDSTSEQLRYGQQLVLRTKIQEVKPLGNPNEFDYSRYLRFHHIIFRGYVKRGDWKVLSTGNPGLIGWFLELRSELIRKFEDAGLRGNELSVASALVLGYRSELDRELMSAYAGAGATHVLAVSGLHVGIVYLILNFLLRFMERTKTGMTLKLVLLILFLWGYACLTGLSPSVSRAATMFTFVAIGKGISRDTNIFNTLAISAFCLLLWEPLIVMQVGFQLSYLAVIGIVLIQPRLFNLWVIENRFFDWAWSITCVSIAAQVATFPLGLLYFHQFPNLFLVSNLLVIPAATMILYLGFCLFLASWWQPTLLFFGFLLQKTISILNLVVVWIERIPYSVLSGIDISTLESLMIYAMIAGLLAFVIQKQQFSLYVSLILMVAFLTMQIVEVNQQHHQRFSTIYNVRNETVVAFANGTDLTFLSSSKFRDDDSAMLFNVKHHWWKKGVEEENWMELSDSVCNRILEFGDRRFAILNLKPSDDKEMSWRISDSLDLVIIHAIPWNMIDRLASLPTSKLIVSNTVDAKT